MQNIIQLNQQILKLQDKKKQLETKQALSLHTHLQKILKNQFSEELILGLAVWAVSELKTTPELQEVWVNACPKFRRPRRAQA